MQGVGGVATYPGAYGGMPGIMQPNVMNPVQTTPNVTGNQFENPFMNPEGFFPSLMMGGMYNLFNPGT